MVWYINDSPELNNDWCDKLRAAGFFRTRGTYNALENFIKQITANPAAFKIDVDLQSAMPLDTYLTLAKAGLLSTTRKVNLIKKLIKYEKNQLARKED